MRKIITQQQKITAPKNLNEFRHGMMTSRNAINDMRRMQPTMDQVIKGFRALDSVSGAFFFRELEYIKKKVYEVQHTPLTFRKMFPVSNEAGPGKKYITFRSFDRIAPSQMITNFSADLPNADVTGKEESIPVKWIGNSFQYNLGEIQSSRVAGGEPLDAKRAKAAFEGIETDLNSLCFSGHDLNSTSGTVPSLFSNPYIAKTTAADGALGSTAWIDKTPDEMLADVNGGFAAVNNNSKNVFEADTWALPISSYNFISATPRSALSDTTILNYIVENSPYLAGLENVIKVPEFTGAATAIGGFTGNDTNDVMLFYNKDAEYVEYEVPVEFQSQPPQERNLAYVINNWANVAGLQIYQPLTMLWVAGI